MSSRNDILTSEIVQQASEDSEKQLLLQDDDVQSLHDVPWQWHQRRISWLSNWQRVLILLVTSVSLLLNASLLVDKLRLLKALDAKGRSKYANLEVEIQMVYQGHTEYSADNNTEVDHLWDDFEVDMGSVAFTAEYANKNGLVKATNIHPWDSAKRMYYVRAFHDMHCLKRLQRGFTEFYNGVPQSSQSSGREHIKHCLDTLRQTIMCAADDTPMPTYQEKHKSTGDGQAMECRSWDKLLEWAQDPEKETCYDSLDDYHPPKHNLERFAYCPKDSKYFPIMKAYFEKWGHKGSD